MLLYYQIIVHSVASFPGLHCHLWYFHCTETTLVWSLPLNMAQSLHSAAQKLEKAPVNM